MARLSGRSRGCRACRERKIKCDEQTPECSQCTRLGKKCPGAVTGLIIFETTPENPQKFQPLGENNPKLSQAPIAAVSPNTDIVLGSGALDPFSSMAVPLDPATNVYFQHFMLHTAACCFPFSPEILAVWSWQEAMTQPAIHFGVLSMAASHRSHLLQEQIGGETSILEIRRSLKYRNEILRITQESLIEAAPSLSKITSIVIMIAYLLCIEGANSNFDAISVHIAGLSSFVQSIGGIDVLDLPTTSFLMGYSPQILISTLHKIREPNSRVSSVDILCAITRGTPPKLPASQKWVAVAMQHPAIRISFSPTDTLESDKISGGIFKLLGTRFSNAPWSTLLDYRLRKTLHNACRLILHYEINELLPKNEKEVNHGDNDPWMLAQRYLLSLSYNHLGPADIQEPLRRSILVCTMTRYCKFGVFPCMDTIATDLKTSLTPRLEVFQTVAPDLFLWILHTGAMAARARKRSPIYQWYCESLAEASRVMNLNDWSEAESLLKQFLYVPRASERLGEDTWRDVMLLRNG